MAITLVKLGTFGDGVQSSFGQSTTAGNLLVMWVANTAGSASAVSITNGVTGWLVAVDQVVSSTHYSQILYKPNCGAGETAPQISNFTQVMLAEFSGADTTSPVDKTGTVQGASSPQTATASGADGASGSLVLEASGHLLSKSGTDTTTHTMNNGATATAGGNNDSTSSGSHARFSYGITTGNSGADTGQATSASMNLAQISIALASFKPASAAPKSLVFEQRRLARNSLLRR